MATRSRERSRSGSGSTVTFTRLTRALGARPGFAGSWLRQQRLNLSENHPARARTSLIAGQLAAMASRQPGHPQPGEPAAQPESRQERAAASGDASE